MRKQTERASSLRVAETMFDAMMMIAFAVLGLLLGGLAIVQHSLLGIIGGVIILLSVIPLWLGGRQRTTGQVRPLRWYPIALAVLIIGLVVWVHPWTGR
ncbi:MAG TPA: hypothetical protein VIP98_23505 [Microlunatus sp.]